MGRILATDAETISKTLGNNEIADLMNELLFVEEKPDEYTDAEALANARVVVGNGTTAQNLPRTTGFVSTFTGVAFSLTCNTLVVGQDYLVSVDLWDSVAVVPVTRQYGFTANAVTHAINDTIPTPASGHSITVRNPRIVFSPP